MQDQAQASQTVSLSGGHEGVNGRKTKRKGAAVAAFPLKLVNPNLAVTGMR